MLLDPIPCAGGCSFAGERTRKGTNLSDKLLMLGKHSLAYLQALAKLLAKAAS